MSPFHLVSVLCLASLLSPLAVTAAPAHPPGDAMPSGCNAAPVVGNANDTGAGSLRAAIQNACGGATVRFAERFVITLASPISINRAVMLDGINRAGDASEAEPLVRIDGAQATRLFSVGTNGSLALRSLRLSNGIGDGAGVNNLGNLIVQRCRFDGHRGGAGSSLGGAAIFNGGNANLQIEFSTFDGNSAGRGAAVFNTGDAEIFNSTFSGNIEGVGEGAIQNRGTLLGVHLTITDNGRLGGNPAAGGLFAFGTDSETTLVNSVIAGNRGPDCRIAGGNILTIGTLVQNPQSCGTPVLTVDPLLQPLAANGGPTRTHAVGAGSATIDTADADFCLDTDQRDVERQAGGPCTIGAFEARGELLFANGFDAVTPPAPMPDLLSDSVAQVPAER